MFNLGRTIRMGSKKVAVNATSKVMQTNAVKKISVMVLSAWLQAKRAKLGLNPNKWDIQRILALMFDLILSPVEIFLVWPMRKAWEMFKVFVVSKWEGTARLKTLPAK